MSPRDVLEAEIRAVCAEMVGSLRIVSESATPLSRPHLRNLILELEHEMAQLARLAAQLP